LSSIIEFLSRARSGSVASSSSVQSSYDVPIEVTDFLKALQQVATNMTEAADVLSQVAKDNERMFQAVLHYSANQAQTSSVHQATLANQTSSSSVPFGATLNCEGT